LRPAELTPAERDALEDIRPSTIDDNDLSLTRFDRGDGDGAVQAAQNDWHDIKAQGADPAIAERQRQEAALKAAAPMRAAAEQDGEMGLGLFDAADQRTFDLDDGKGPRTATAIGQEIESDRAAIDAIRECLL